MNNGETLFVIYKETEKVTSLTVKIKKRQFYIEILLNKRLWDYMAIKITQLQVRSSLFNECQWYTKFSVEEP